MVLSEYQILDRPRKEEQAEEPWHWHIDPVPGLNGTIL
jgi:hypothetical protein